MAAQNPYFVMVTSYVIFYALKKAVFEFFGPIGRGSQKLSEATIFLYSGN